MPNPSLADLDNKPAATTTTTVVDPLPDPAKPAIESGDGTKPAANLEEEQQRQRDATALEAKRLADEAAADTTTTTIEPETSIWEDVDALRGEPLEVKWEDGQGAIPEEEWDTPRGILARERALETRAVTRFEETLRKEDPRGYQYLLHRHAGGTDEEFFAQKTITLPDYERFKESVDLQVKVYTDDLRNAGLSEKAIKNEVDRAVKDKEILELSDRSYKKQEASEQKAIKDLNTQLEQDQLIYTRNVQVLDKTISEQIASKDMSIVVPEAKREEFKQYVRQRVRYDEQTRTFLFSQPIDHKLLPRQLEALYLQFVNGDLGGLIQREAQSANTKRLRRTIEKSKEVIKDAGSDAGKGKKTLGEL